MKAKPPLLHSILLLTYNRPILLARRVFELEKIYRHRDDIELVVLENGGDEACWKAVQKACEIFPACDCFLSRRNMGFGPAFNWLAKRADGAVLHFLSNDVHISDGFFYLVDRELDKNPDAVICQHLIDWPAGWNQFGDIIIIYPAGHYLACRKETWQKLNGFDERFVPHDYEDVDIGMKCLKMSIPIIAIPVLPMRHEPASTVGYTPERRINTLLQRERFAEKWGLPNIPREP